MKQLALLLSLLLVSPLHAQEAAPQDAPTLRERAIQMMSHTPLITYDKSQAMLIAEKSYECAGYLNGMGMFVDALANAGKLPAEVPLDDFTRLAESIGAVYVGLAQIVHLIYEVSEDESLSVKVEQYKIAYDNVITLSPSELDTRYGDPCEALLQTYLPGE